MSERETTGKIIDEIIRFGVGGTALAAGLAVPGLLVGLEKPLAKLFATMDEREKKRELRRIVYQMKEKGLLAGDYEHGLQVTEKARKRLEVANIRDMQAVAPRQWDGTWRIIIYDIPEDRAISRQALADRLRAYGCFQLQKSTWITPFPCRTDVVTLSSRHDVDQFVTYFEATHLDNSRALIARFARKYPNTNFHFSPRSRK